MEDHSAAIFIVVTAPLTMLSILLIFILHFLIPSLQVKEFKMVIYMFLGDFIQTLKIFTNAIWQAQRFKQLFKKANDKFICIFSAFFSTLGCLISFFWIINISYMLSQSFTSKNFNPIGCWRRAKFIGFILPFLLAIIPWASQSYGYSEPSLRQTNCYILGGPGQLKNNLIRVFIFYVPLWFAICYSTYTICKLNIQASRIFQPGSIILRRIRYLFFYPIILIFCWSYVIFAQIIYIQDSVIRIVETFHSENPRWNRYIFCFTNLNGFLNSIVYFITVYEERQHEKSLSTETIKITLIQQYSETLQNDSISIKEQIKEFRNGQTSLN